MSDEVVVEVETPEVEPEVETVAEEIPPIREVGVVEGEVAPGPSAAVVEPVEGERNEAPFPLKVATVSEPLIVPNVVLSYQEQADPTFQRKLARDSQRQAKENALAAAEGRWAERVA